MFPASLRRDSHQARLIRYLMAQLPGGYATDILRPEEVDLPLFNQDMEHDPVLAPRLQALHARFMAADAVIIASPEYNGHVSPYLKNTIDWVSRLARIDPAYATANPFKDKPLLLTSASTGWTGGLLGLRDARSLFAYVGFWVAADQICVADADHWVGGDSYQFETGFADFVTRVVGDFVTLVARAQAGQVALAVAGGRSG